VKTPFEFVTSAARATAAEITDAMPLVRTLQQLGMPLYQCQPPTGYKDTADAWVNTGALVSRMNFALQLASGKLPGVVVAGVAGVAGAAGADSVPSPASGQPSVLSTALNDDVTSTTRATIAKATSPEQMAALTLGAPEFQRR
jgi:uncharacterized protein (DUF1800 family)